MNDVRPGAPGHLGPCPSGGGAEPPGGRKRPRSPESTGTDLGNVAGHDVGKSTSPSKRRVWITSGLSSRNTTIERQDILKLHAQSWWLALEDGRLIDEEREHLIKQRDQFSLSTEDIQQVVGELNREYDEQRLRVRLIPCIKNVLCAHFQITVQDLERAYTGRRVATPGYFAKFLRLLVLFMTQSNSFQAEYRWQMRIDVIGYCLRRFGQGRPLAAFSDYCAFVRRSWTADVTMGMQWVDSFVRLLRIVLNGCILVWAWQSWGLTWGRLAKLIINCLAWLFSSWVKDLLRSWQKALTRRVPFLVLQLENHYEEWLQERGYKNSRPHQA